MFKAGVVADRATAERLSELVAGLDPAPASAVSTEEVSRTQWRFDAFCLTQSDAEGVAAIIAFEMPDARVSVQKLEDRDWVAESLKGLPAVNAGPFVVAGAHVLSRVGAGRIPVWIEAGPAFGTGHHGTTKGCLEALAEVMRQGPVGRVLDLGTGSGVLSIAALKAGASHAVATDIDAESLRIARENARNNRIAPAIRFVHAAGANHAAIRGGAPYDVVMANILARPLVGLSPDISRLVRPGGRIILSGLLNHQEPQVRGAYESRGLLLVDRRQLNGWSTLVYRRPVAALPARRPAAATSSPVARQHSENAPKSARPSYMSGASRG